ncbi:MAG: translation initiation factor IF-2 subunit beta [Candidatus Heimdallarchaeota archaeon]
MNDSDYEQLLDRAIKSLPETVKKTGSRFTIPQINVFYEGNRTIIRNWKEIEDTLRRDGSHILKVLTRELATAGIISGLRAILQGKFPTSQIERTFERYVKDYVICSACKRPDTEIIKKEKLAFLVCHACGARHPLPSH